VSFHTCYYPAQDNWLFRHLRPSTLSTDLLIKLHCWAGFMRLVPEMSEESILAYSSISRPTADEELRTSVQNLIEYLRYIETRCNLGIFYLQRLWYFDYLQTNLSTSGEFMFCCVRGRWEFHGGNKFTNLVNYLQFVEHGKQNQLSKQWIKYVYKKYVYRIAMAVIHVYFIISSRGR